MKAYSIAILVFGEINSGRNALIEDKYKGLALAFSAKGIRVDSLIYNDLLAERLEKTGCFINGTVKKRLSSFQSPRNNIKNWH